MYTEQNIRGLAINFLRQHYKLRPRLGTTGTEVVTKVHYYRGVTIDARMSYQRPDGSWFMATVEATSVDRAHEVLYRVNWFRITVHALALSILLMVIGLGVLALADRSVFSWYGRPGTYLFLLSALISCWALIGAAISRLRYYRYIYAIAQFMRFHADAQWIAFDRNIFFAPDDEEVSGRAARRYNRRMRRFYDELQRQCVRFGFGLMEVREANKVRWLIEPSHIDQFAGTRLQLPRWVRTIQPPPVIGRLRGRLPVGKPSAPLPAPAPPPEMADPLAVGSYLPRRVREVDYRDNIVAVAGKRRAWYRRPARTGLHLRWTLRHAYRSLYPPEIRRRPGYYELPWWFIVTFFAGLIAFGLLTYEHARWRPEARPGQVQAAPPIAPLEPAASPALSDARAEVLPGEYDPNLTAREFAERNEPAIGIGPVVNSSVGSGTGVTVLEIDEAHRATPYYDCLPLFLTEGTLYLIVEGQYKDYPTAVERAELLNDTHEVTVGVAARSCIDPLATNYLLYLGGVQATEAAANLALRRLRRETDLDLEAIAVR